MEQRRDFIKNSAFSILGSTLMFSPEKFYGDADNSTFLVRQPEDCETVFVRENTPITFHITKLADNLQTISICSEEIQVGGKIPIHKHIKASEYFYFLSGNGTIMCNDVETPFKAGTSAYVPMNLWHSVTNTGNEPVKMLFGFSPAGFEDFFRQVGTPKGQTFQAKPKETFDAICRQFGMVFK